jgi:hypothetical protein
MDVALRVALLIEKELLPGRKWARKGASPAFILLYRACVHC